MTGGSTARGKLDLREVVPETVNWIQTVRGRIEWRDSVKARNFTFQFTYLD
jgi:hypothetical protein